MLQNLKFTQINSGRVQLARSSLLFDAACRPKMQTFQSNSQWLQRNATIQCALSLFFVKNQVSGCLKCGCKEPKLRANLDAPCHPQSQTQTDCEVQLPVLQASWTAMRHSTHSTHLIRLIHSIHVAWFKAKPQP